ncbi:MAG TPA: aspartate-semialdehyde dehydrogenase [Ktedonobacterales bacterium]|nr:aspartate-semialdehyde dehydrogenase [Ktedonobacterales bacterium]
MSNTARIPVAVLGATGMVGQRFISLLAEHPWFEVAVVAGSERSANQRYGDAVTWRLPSAPPRAVLDLPVVAPDAEFDAPVVFSALPASVAAGVELLLAERGHAIFSNASSHRMAEDVPLLIAEVNGDHVDLLTKQQEKRGWPGLLVTNGNCSTIQIALALKPLADAFGVKRLQVTTLQAITGAGYPGVASYDVLDNVIPYIGSEEEKIESETRKILGAYQDGAVTPAPMTISAQCNRVAVRDGHLACISVELGRDAVTSADLVDAWQAFRAEPQERKLPSAPQPPIVVRDEPDRPQPFFDRDAGGGMAVTVGRVRPCPILGHKFIVLGHNTIRGAAGASILNAELLLARGWLGADGRPARQRN